MIVVGLSALAAFPLQAARPPHRACIQWKCPAVPKKGTPQYDAVAAAYAFRTPDRAFAFSNDWAFATAIYGRDYSRGCPAGIVVESFDAARDSKRRGAIMQRLMDALEPGDLVAACQTNGAEDVLFYAGDVYGDRHGYALYPHRYGGFIVEHAAATLVNWPQNAPHKLRLARSFRLLRPLKDSAIRLSARRAFPRGVTTISADERVQAVLSLAWARYLKGRCIQYDLWKMVSESVQARTKRQTWYRTDFRQTVEEATADHTGFTVCSVFPYETYWELFNYRLSRDGFRNDTQGVFTYNLTRRPARDILAYRYDRKENAKPAEQVLKEAWDVLEPGDVIIFAYVYRKKPGGHAMLYVGEVDGVRMILHSGGIRFSYKSMHDPVEYDGTMLKDDVYGYLFAPGKDGTIATSELMKHDQFVILRPLKRSDLALTPSGRARAKLPKFRYDRRVKGGLYGSVLPGETLQYGVEVWNAAHTPCDATVVETVPEGTEFLSASRGCVVSGRRLTWPVTLAPGESRVVSWKVKVTAKPGERIVSGGGSAGGIPSNTLSTEVVPRTLTAAEALAWAEAKIRKGGDLPACRVRKWCGGYEADTPPREERVYETRSRDLMVGDVVLSIPKRGPDEEWRLWVKAPEGLCEKGEGGRLVRVPEEEVDLLVGCDFFMAFRPAAEPGAAK